MTHGWLRGGRLPYVLRQVLLCALGFLAVAEVVRRFVPWPEEYGLRAKIGYFLEHADEFDLIFLGSSRVFRAFDPRAFDAELEAHGIACRSFNLGVGGMRGFEQDYVLRRLLELRPARLRWVLIEGGEWDPEFDYSFNAWSWRNVFWHSPGETAAVLAALWGGNGPLGHRLDLAATHLGLALSKLACYGQGRQALFALTGETLDDERDRRLGPEALAAQRGFQPGEELAREKGLALEDLFSDPENYRRKVERLAGTGGERSDLAGVPLFAQRAQVRLAREHGVGLFYVLPPGLEPNPVRRTLHERGEIPILFDFNLVDRYPRLFDMEHRVDPRHLNARGATWFSRALARELVPHLSPGAAGEEGDGG